MATPGKLALLKIMSTAAATPFTGEATTPDATRTVFTISDRDYKYWAKDEDVNVYFDSSSEGSLVAANQYRIQPAGGKIHFHTAVSTSQDVVVTGESVAVTAAAEINSYSYSINREINDITAFKSTGDSGIGWRDKQPNLADVSGTISGFYVVDNLFTDRILESEKVVLEFDVDQDTTDEGDIFACYAVLESDELSAAIEGSVGKSVSWQSDGDILVESK